MKAEIKKQLLEKNQKELNSLKETLKTSENLVQKGDLKSDGKYDTRATEANYLADGLRQRLNDLEHERLLLEDLPLRDLTSKDEVCIGAMVKIEHNHQKRWYYISPTSGGSLLNIEGEALMVISVFSPIGREILDLTQNDEFEVEINDQTRLYKILDIK
tara:strand:+ start:3385 stop:3861 length:477 start_codon:yes stop_codon:yes gene_type:complete